MSFRRFSLLLALPLAACGGGDDAEPGMFDQLRETAQAVENVQGMGDKMEELAERANQPPATPVDFRKLKELLPETLAGLPRTNAEGSRQAMGEFSVSQAEGSYGDGDKTLSVTVIDLGGAQAAMMFGAMWTIVEMDREDDTSYERTTEVNGSPGYVKYDSESRNGEIQALVADRFLVKVSGSGVGDDELQQAVDGISFKTLDGWRDEGRAAS